jgi:ATP-dependent DNA ligase
LASELGGADAQTAPSFQYRQHNWGDYLSRVAHGVDNILFSEALSAEGVLLFAKACELVLEGIVSKRAGSRYRSRNSLC